MEDTLVFMYERALREVPLFGKVERSFIRVITQHLHEMYFLKGDTVIQCRDVQSFIFIIYRGKVRKHVVMLIALKSVSQVIVIIVIQATDSGLNGWEYVGQSYGSTNCINYSKRQWF